MRFLLLFLVIIIFSIDSFSQTRFMVAGGMDVIKTDFREPFEKVQGGIEVNYFLKQKLSLSLGFEYWSGQQNYFAIGSRVYLFSFVFFQPKILFNSNDLNGSLSIGYKYFLNRRWRWENTIDYYTDSPELALRTGFSYVFTR